MNEKIVVMPGPGRIDPTELREVAGEFGWDVEVSNDLRTLAVAQACQRTAAVFFHREAFGASTWLDAVRLLREAFPEALLVACHGFADPIDWPVLCDAGLFHSLWLPLKESEVRRSFGFLREAAFVQEARKRAAQPARRVPVAARAQSIPHGVFASPRQQRVFAAG